MKRAIFTFLLMYCSVQSYAQQIHPSQLIDTKIEKPTDWELYIYNQDFKIEYKFVDCDPNMGFDQESVVLKFTNRTANKLRLNWHLYLHYDEVCRTCDYPEEYSYELSMEPNQQIEGDCLTEGGYALKIFSKFIDQAYSKGGVLTAFKLANLDVTQTVLD